MRISKRKAINSDNEEENEEMRFMLRALHSMQITEPVMNKSATKTGHIRTSHLSIDLNVSTPIVRHDRPCLATEDYLASLSHANAN